MEKLQIENSIRNTYFVNLNTISYGTVFKTQVLNWLKIYDQYGIHFDLITIESLKSLMTGKRIFDEKIVRMDFNNKFMRIYTAKTGSQLSNLIVFIVLWLILRKHWKNNRTVILQTRSEAYYKPLGLIKKIMGDRFRIIYDSRGSLPEEYRYEFFEASETPAVKHKIEVMRKFEKSMVMLADRVFCVSNALKKYHLMNNNNVVDSKFFVSPCNADPKLFYHDKQTRVKLRDELSLSNKKIIVYSGGLEMPWHIPESVFELFSRICDTNTELLLLVLTQDDGMARELQKKYNILPEQIKIYSIDNKEVCAYLNVADWAILLRHDMPVNNVASPTKFAEYLMTGLPVIISPNVGDFSDFVVEHDVGFIIPTPFRDEDLEKLKIYLSKQIKPKEEIAVLGKECFSKEANLESKIENYLTLARKD